MTDTSTEFIGGEMPGIFIPYAPGGKPDAKWSSFIDRWLYLTFDWMPAFLELGGPTMHGLLRKDVPRGIKDVVDRFPSQVKRAKPVFVPLGSK